MPEERDDQEQDQQAVNRWKYPIAGLVVLIFAGLVVYQTVRTGEIPLTIAGPLLAAALWAMFTFSLSDFTGGKKE